MQNTKVTNKIVRNKNWNISLQSMKLHDNKEDTFMNL